MYPRTVMRVYSRATGLQTTFSQRPECHGIARAKVQNCADWLCCKMFRFINVIKSKQDEMFPAATSCIVRLLASSRKAALFSSLKRSRRSVWVLKMSREAIPVSGIGSSPTRSFDPDGFAVPSA